MMKYITFKYNIIHTGNHYNITTSKNQSTTESQNSPGSCLRETTKKEQRFPTIPTTCFSGTIYSRETVPQNNTAKTENG